MYSFTLHAMMRMKPIVSNNEWFYIKPYLYEHEYHLYAELCLGFFLSRALWCLLKHSVNTHMFRSSQAGRGQQAALIECEEWLLTLWSTWPYKSHPKPSRWNISLHWERFTVYYQMEVPSSVTMYFCTMYNIFSDYEI